MLETNLAHRLSSSCVCACACGRAVLPWPNYVCIHALSVHTFIVNVRFLSAFRSRTSWVRRQKSCTRKFVWSSSFLKSMSRYRLPSVSLSSWHGTEQQSTLIGYVCVHVGNVQAQRTILELQAQLDLLKDSESLQADTEDVAQLKVGQWGLTALLVLLNIS